MKHPYVNPKARALFIAECHAGTSYKDIGRMFGMSGKWTSNVARKLRAAGFDVPFRGNKAEGKKVRKEPPKPKPPPTVAENITIEFGGCTTTVGSGTAGLALPFAASLLHGLSEVSKPGWKVAYEKPGVEAWVLGAMKADGVKGLRK